MCVWCFLWLTSTWLFISAVHRQLYYQYSNMSKVSSEDFVSLHNNKGSTALKDGNVKVKSNCTARIICYIIPPSQLPLGAGTGRSELVGTDLLSPQQLDESRVKVVGVFFLRCDPTSHSRGVIGRSDLVSGTLIRLLGVGGAEAQRCQQAQSGQLLEARCEAFQHIKDRVHSHIRQCIKQYIIMSFMSSAVREG